MQLTTRTWRLTLFAIGALVVLLALQSIGVDVHYRLWSLSPEDRSEFDRRMYVSTALRREATAYVRERLNAVLDSLDRAAASPLGERDRVPPAGASPAMVSVVAIDSVGRAARGGVEALAARELEMTPVLQTPLRIVVLSTPRALLPRLVARDGGDASVTRYVRLPATQGEPCTLVFTTRAIDIGSLTATLNNANGVLGPCAFYAAFGTPGKALRAHLDSAAWYPAAFARWRDTLDVGEALRFPWSDLSRDGVRCLVRADDACDRGWLADTQFDGDEEFVEPPVMATAALPIGLPLSWFGVRGNGVFGLRQRLWLSDLVREVGEARFGEFWRREAPFDPSFRELAGMSARAWTGDWLARSYTRYAASPRPSRAELGWWAFVVMAAIAVLATARERRVR